MPLEMVFGFVFSIVALGSVTSVIKLWIKRREVPVRLPPGMDERLARMEQSMESMAVEIERIAEGQRFTTKLLSERSKGSSSP
jgi:hypothetical protein